MIQLLVVQMVPHQVVGGAAFATSFTSAPGTPVDGVPTTLYTIAIDMPKAAAAKALGEYITAEAVAEEKLKVVSVKVAADQDSLPRKIDFQVGTATVSVNLSEFGDPVTIAAPPAA